MQAHMGRKGFWMRVRGSKGKKQKNLKLTFTQRQLSLCVRKRHGRTKCLPETEKVLEFLQRREYYINRNYAVCKKNGGIQK